jgi:hypothetical protein
MTVANEDPRHRYLERARDALRGALLRDFLGFLTVRRFAGGSATARFYDAFPVRRGGAQGGRAELIHDLTTDATPTDIAGDAPITTRTALRLMRLVADLKDRKPEALAELTAIAVEDFELNFDSEENAAGDTLRLLMLAAARADPDARRRLREYYSALTDAHAGPEAALLMALGREPIASVGSVENFAAIITALLDGLAVRARIGEPARELLEAALLPIVAALTVPAGAQAPSPQELLYAPDANVA